MAMRHQREHGVIRKPHSSFHSLDALARPGIGRDAAEIEEQGVRIVSMRSSPCRAFHCVLVPDYELLILIDGDAGVGQRAVVTVTPDRRLQTLR